MQAKRKTQQTNEMNETQYVWRDRKRIFFGLPWTFTRYCLTGEKLLIDTGFLSRCEEEVWLYRILDLTLRRSLWERMFHLGTIHCCAGDQSQPEFDIKHVKHAKAVKEMLSDMVERERMERRVGVRELMQGAEEGDMFSQDDVTAVHMDEE